MQVKEKKRTMSVPLLLRSVPREPDLTLYLIRHSLSCSNVAKDILSCPAASLAVAQYCPDPPLSKWPFSMQDVKKTDQSLKRLKAELRKANVDLVLSSP